MGFDNHAQRSTPPYYLHVDNPFPKNFLIVGNPWKAASLSMYRVSTLSQFDFEGLTFLASLYHSCDDLAKDETLMRLKTSQNLKRNNGRCVYPSSIQSSQYNDFLIGRGLN